MARFPNWSATRVWLLVCSTVALIAVIATLTVRTSTHQLQLAKQSEKDVLLNQIAARPVQPLRAIGNDDCPLRIVEANVKEIAGVEFTKLTGKTTDLGMVSSVPEVTLVNVSGRLVTRFMIAIRDPQSRTTRVFIQNKISIPPAATYVVKRENFVDPKRATIPNGDGTFRHTKVQPQLDSEGYWLQFAGRSQVFITVGEVTFADGSGWKIKEGGEVK